MFDRWDNTLKTGIDTEYILVLVALCVGALFVLARLTVAIPPRTLESSNSFLLHQLRNSFLFLICPFAMTPALQSPLLTLRI